MLSHVLQTLAGFFEVRRGLLALLDEAGGARAAVAHGWGEGDAKLISSARSSRQSIVTTKAPVIIEDVTSDPRFAGWPADEGTGVAVIAPD